jgi:activator of HSP90 ATPase
MSSDPALSVATPTRRHLIASLAFAIGGLASGSDAFASPTPPMPEQRGVLGKSPCTIHQETRFDASPHRIYEALLDSKQFAAFSGFPAEVGRDVGNAFSMFGNRILGRNIELVPDLRIVQAWRPADWSPGVYSLVKFEFVRHGSQTNVVLDHTGFPDGTFEHLNAGWKLRYWDPLQKYFG